MTSDIPVLQIDRNYGYMDVEAYIKAHVDASYVPAFTTPPQGDSGVLATFLASNVSQQKGWTNGFFENSAKVSYMSETGCNPPVVMLTPKGQAKTSVVCEIDTNVFAGVVNFLDHWFQCTTTP